MNRTIIKKVPAAETDELLLQQYQKGGDQKHLAVLFERYVDLIYGVCLKYLRSPDGAKDAVMGIYEDLILKARKHEVTNFRGWIYRFSVNFCLMVLRKDKTRPKIVNIDDVFMQSADVFHHDIAAENEARLNIMHECLQTLPLNQKEAVVLFYLKEKCYKEIAQTTNQEVNKIRSYIQNGRRNLKICMEKHDKVE